MGFKIPLYIDNTNINLPELRFMWDDWEASNYYKYDSEKVVKKLLGLTPRAQISIGVGIYEWIIWRFRSICVDSLPYQLAEAAWCGMLDHRYMKYTEIERRQWMGPVKGPLWCAITWMIPMVFYKEQGEVELESGLAYLPALAVHVLPNPIVFEDWLNGCIERLLKFYPAEEDNLFNDLFGEEDHGGPPVPRDALDLHFDFKPNQVDELIDKYLRGVDLNNPFLNTPDEMIKDGFEGIPYKI